MSFWKQIWTPVRPTTPRTEEPGGAEPTRIPDGTKYWWDVSILQLANFLLKFWIAQLLIALVLGVVGLGGWLLFTSIIARNAK